MKKSYDQMILESLEITTKVSGYLMYIWLLTPVQLVRWKLSWRNKLSVQKIVIDLTFKDMMKRW